MSYYKLSNVGVLEEVGALRYKFNDQWHVMGPRERMDIECSGRSNHDEYQHDDFTQEPPPFVMELVIAASGRPNKSIPGSLPVEVPPLEKKKYPRLSCPMLSPLASHWIYRPGRSACGIELGENVRAYSAKQFRGRVGHRYVCTTCHNEYTRLHQ